MLPWFIESPTTQKVLSSYRAALLLDLLKPENTKETLQNWDQQESKLQCCFGSWGEVKALCSVCMVSNFSAALGWYPKTTAPWVLLQHPSCTGTWLPSQVCSSALVRKSFSRGRWLLKMCILDCTGMIHDSFNLECSCCAPWLRSRWAQRSLSFIIDGSRSSSGLVMWHL